jgi:hypothetical protein
MPNPQEYEMTRFTEKTIRTETQWVKVTRDNKDRTFTFARGYNSNTKATEIQVFPFKYVSTWEDATEKATRMINNYS